VDPALAPFAEFVRGITFHQPNIPCISTSTGRWITGQEISQPEYWTRQLRGTVRFADAIREAASTPARIFLEVGPAETLVQLVRQTIQGKANGAKPATHAVVASLPGVRDGVAEDKAILSALGRLWLAGATPDWKNFHANYSRKRTLLPTYPFERKKFWVEPPSATKTEMVQAPATLPLPTASSADFTLPKKDLEMATSVAAVNSMLPELQLLITDLSGIDLAGTDAEASFLELGFDSLFLTQLTQSIQAKYRVKLTFRQIMESYPTLGTLAAHLESIVAPELRASKLAPVVPLTNAIVDASPSAATAFMPAIVPALPSGSMEALFAAQTQALTGLFQQQLAALRGVSAATALPVQQSIPQAHAVAPTVPAAVSSKEIKPAKPAFTPFKPLQRSDDNKLNSVQEAYLQNLVSSYNRRSGSSKKFTQDHRKVFADGRVVSGFNAQLKDLVYPLVVERAKGPYLWDKDGNRYIDILNGYGAILFGHSPDFVLEAVRKQLELGFAIGPQTELAGECAELLSELTGMERVTFCNTGSEAVMGAMRLARTVTGRNLVVLFSGDYHGSFDEVLVKAVGGHRTMPVAPGIPRESVANILVLDYGTPESLEIIRQRADEIAAVLVEPVQSRHPDLRPIEFLKEVRRITAQSGAALIFDEVVTGFRTHPGGMQAVYGIRADLATYGKVIAGGLPMGILAGSSTFMDALDGGMWQYGDASFPEVGVTFYAGTFMRHPLALAGVRACLQHIKQQGPEMQKTLAMKTAALVSDLRRMLTDFSHPSAIETYSSWFYLPAATEPFLARMLHFHLREQGVHIQEGFPCFLTTTHTDADLDFVREAFHNSLRAIVAQGAIGGSNLCTKCTF